MAGIFRFLGTHARRARDALQGTGREYTDTAAAGRRGPDHAVEPPIVDRDEEGRRRTRGRLYRDRQAQ